MKYVFILYLNRSGSTFLANQLSKNEKILVCPEAEVLVNMLVKNYANQLNSKQKRKLEVALKDDPKLKYWNLEPDADKSYFPSNLDMFFSFLEQYKSKTKPDSSVIVFKAVDLLSYIEKLQDYGIEKGLDINFISLVRDPRGIFNSQRQTFVGLRNKFMNRNPLNTVYQWNSFIFQSLKYASSDEFIILKFEDLLNDFDVNMLRIFKLIGISETLPVLRQQGDLKSRIPDDQLSMHSNIEDPPMPGKANQWRDELKISTQVFIQRSASESLLQMGYTIRPIDIPGISYFMMWIKYKTDLALKDLYRTCRKIFCIPS